MDVRPGDFVTITDVVTNTNNNKTTMSTKTKSKVEKCVAPERTRIVMVEGVFVNGDVAELLLTDNSCPSVSAELLHEALCSEEDTVPDIELCTALGPGGSQSNVQRWRDIVNR